MGLFDKVYNKGFAEPATKLNQGINKVVGKEVFKDVRPIEAPREFADFSSFPQYDKEEPAAWSPRQGEERVFSLSGETISVSKEFDACMAYREDFREAATYYTERFKYRYSECVNDFDTFTHYFKDLYSEGLVPMLQRSFSLLLPFGVFDISNETFGELHTSLFNRAIQSYAIMSGVEDSINQKAQNMGNAVGGSFRMQGGGFGFKNAMKGAAKAEAFNLGMGLLGKFVSHEMKMTPEQKAAAYSAFKTDVFFTEVYSDYYNTLLTLIAILTKKGYIKGVKVILDEEGKTLLNNLNNPLFPKERAPQALATMISTYPFEKTSFTIAEKILGNTSECAALKGYFLG